MKETLEKLWCECFAEECATIQNDEESALVRRAVEMHKIAEESLTKEQCDRVEKYAEALYDIQGTFVKKAFFKGCEFTASFLLEAGNFKKA